MTVNQLVVQVRQFFTGWIESAPRGDGRVPSGRAKINDTWSASGNCSFRDIDGNIRTECESGQTGREEVTNDLDILRMTRQ
jgi:hypothetical protein